MLIDGAPTHKIKNFANLHLVKLPPGVTSYYQPCDVLFFACLKQKYKKQLAQVLWNKPDDRRFVSEGEGAKLLMEEFEKMDQKVVDLSFKKTGLPIYDVTCDEGNLSEEEIKQMLEEEENDRLLRLELEKMVSFFLLFSY